MSQQIDYTDEAKEVFQRAQGLSVFGDLKNITLELWLLSCLEDKNSEGAKFLIELGADIFSIEERIRVKYNIEESTEIQAAPTVPLAKETETLLIYVGNEVENGSLKTIAAISTAHILYCVIKRGNNSLDQYLGNIKEEDARRYLFSKRKDSSKDKKSSLPDNMKHFVRNLNELAKEGKIDPVVGRDKEIERMIVILGRKKKNNPILIGDAGVGKTSIVEGLAIRIIQKKVPLCIENKIILALDMNAVAAGCKFRGMFEERMKFIIDEVTKNKDLILFIDEIHTVIGAGNSEGGLDAANILKPALARGDISAIGATTLNEFKKHIEKDPALDRRFQQIYADEPSPEEALEIIMNIRKYYEDFHHVVYDPEALEAMVELSVKFLVTRYLPDKAIDLMDESGSKVKTLASVVPEDLTKMSERIISLDEEIKKLVQEEDYESCDKLKVIRDDISGKYEAMKKKLLNSDQKELRVQLKHIHETIATATGIPVDKIGQTDIEKLLNMPDELKSEIIGQEEAIESLVGALKRNIVGLKDPKKPIGSFIFLGPTGVGKTDLVKKLCKLMFNFEDAIIRIDMSEYMEKFNISKLVGAPPGYVGYDEGGYLTEKVKRKPYSIILVDEIEKAHPDVFNIFLQILDDGHLTDSFQRKINFKNTIIIFTSNAGTSFTKRQFGFGEPGKDNYKENIKSEFEKRFSMEFRNRIDEVIYFNKLEDNDLKKIIDINIKIVNNLLKSKHINIEITDEVRNDLLEKSRSEFGARKVKRVIKKYIEDLITDEILQGRINDSENVIISMEEDKYLVSKHILTVPSKYLEPAK